MTSGIRISKRDYGVDDPDQKQILISTYPLLKLFKKDSGVLVKGAGDTIKIVEISHNLGYKPQVYVFGEYCDLDDYPTITVVERYRLFNFSDTPGLQLWDWYRFYTDNNKLYIKYTSNSFVASEVSLNYFYYIFYDEQG